MLPDNKHLIFRLEVSLALTLVLIVGYFVYDLLKN